MQCNAALGVGYVGVVAIFGRSADGTLMTLELTTGRVRV
jgi:hypothetical protein